MNGKKLFFLSIIILSVAMGIHWFKHKPKVKKKRRRRPRVALNIDDLQIQDKTEKKNNNDKSAENSKESSSKETDNNGNENGENVGNNKHEDTASSTQNIDEGEQNKTASSTTGLQADPVIYAFAHLKRNPFELSPYVKLVKKIKEEEAKAAEESGKGKETKLLNAKFTATIKTEKELVAVIDAKLYRKGNPFKNGKIASITKQLVLVTTPTTLYIIPKVGVKVNIASSGKYTYDDTFLKK